VTSTYFISDLHLDSARPSTSRAFFRFLKGISDDKANCHSLYILGDLFEAWPGDDDDSALAKDVCAALATFNSAKPRTYLMHGNRDFLIGEKFCTASGAQLLEDPSLINLYGDNVLIMHGDALCTEDTEYQSFRAMVRDPVWQAEILALSLEERRKIARSYREKSHEAKSNKPEDIVDVTLAAVESAMARHSVDKLIHGHTHRPGCFSTGLGQRWVLGDWEYSPTILKVTSEEWSAIDINID
jgi:UDP-2,3-diacylglucosamine hydrolase